MEIKVNLDLDDFVNDNKKEVYESLMTYDSCASNDILEDLIKIHNEQNQSNCIDKMILLNIYLPKSDYIEDGYNKDDYSCLESDLIKMEEKLKEINSFIQISRNKIKEWKK